MSVDVAVTLAGAPVSGDLVLADVAIRSGRQRMDDGISPASATLEFLTANPAGGGVEIAQPLQILVNTASRFVGRVSEITMGASLDGETATYTVVAIGNMAQLERVTVAVPLVAETAAARASRVITAAGFVPTVQGGTTYNMAAYGKAGDPPATAASVLGDLMSDTGAVIADLGSGGILAQFPEARISADRFTPDPRLTHVDVDFEMTDDLVNDVALQYAGVTQTAQNTASIAKYGKHSISMSTGLADAGSATRRGGSIVSRLGVPAWQVGNVETWDERFLVGAHEPGAVVSLSPLGVMAPMDGSWVGVLEGWIEHYRPLNDGSNRLGGSFELMISDQRHAAEALTWGQANPAEKWSTVLPATRWQDVISNANL